MDDDLRRLERLAAQGDHVAEARLRRERQRAGLGVGAYMIDVLEGAGLGRADMTSIALGVRAILRGEGVRGVRVDVCWGGGHRSDPTTVDLTLAPTVGDEVAAKLRDLLHGRPEPHLGDVVIRPCDRHRLYVDRREALPLERAKTHLQRKAGPWLAAEHHAVFCRRVARAEARHGRGGSKPMPSLASDEQRPSTRVSPRGHSQRA